MGINSPRMLTVPSQVQSGPAHSTLDCQTSSMAGKTHTSCGPQATYLLWHDGKLCGSSHCSSGWRKKGAKGILRVHKEPSITWHREKPLIKLEKIVYFCLCLPYFLPMRKLNWKNNYCILIKLIVGPIKQASIFKSISTVNHAFNRHYQ